MNTSLSGRIKSAIVRPHKSSMSKGEITNSPSPMPSSSVRFMYMNVNHKRYITAPSNKKISNTTSTSYNVGPGKYSIQDINQGPSFEFSKVPRFNNDKLLDLLHRQSSRQKFRIHEKIDFNKDLSKVTPIEKFKRIKESAMKRKIKAEIIKITRDNIVKQKKELTESMIKEKYEKIEYRKRIIEIRGIKIA